MSHRIEFRPSGRGKAQCAPDPHYPDGIKLDTSVAGRPYCLVKLPYPAPECGLWMILCEVCKMTAAVTAAGRVDDPISIKLECEVKT